MNDGIPTIPDRVTVLDRDDSAYSFNPDRTGYIERDGGVIVILPRDQWDDHDPDRPQKVVLTHGGDTTTYRVNHYNRASAVRVDCLHDGGTP